MPCQTSTFFLSPEVPGFIPGMGVVGISEIEDVAALFNKEDECDVRGTNARWLNASVDNDGEQSRATPNVDDKIRGQNLIFLLLYCCEVGGNVRIGKFFRSS